MYYGGPGPDATTVIDVVSEVFNLDSTSIGARQAGRRTAKNPRKVAMYLCQHHADMSLKAITEEKGLRVTSSVSPAIVDVEQQLECGQLELESLLKILN